MPAIDGEARGWIRHARAMKRRFVNSRSIISQKSFIKHHPDRWSCAVGRNDRVRHPARIFGPESIDLASMLEDIPDLGVLHFPDGWVAGYQGWAFTADGKIVEETTWYGRDLRNHHLPRRAAGRRLDGTCLSIVTEFAAGNYGHFVLDGLSRIGIAERAGHSVAGIDYVYLNKPVSPSAAMVLRDLGVRPDQCIWVEDEPAISAENLLVTTFPGTKRNYAPIVPETLSKPFAGAAGHGRRLYIPRAGTREMINESDIESILAAYAIEKYDFRACDNEPEFFRSAELIVGAHGAGLTNIAFCRPGTKILEIIPSDHAYPYFYTVAESAGLDYAYMVGKSVGMRPAGTFGPSPYDFKLDPETFRSALGQLIAEIEARPASP